MNDDSIQSHYKLDVIMSANAETIAAIKESRQGKLAKANDVKGFLKAMHAND